VKQKRNAMRVASAQRVAARMTPGASRIVMGSGII
jgi:hypothetical protein